jgi:hypothetical protein
MLLVSLAAAFALAAAETPESSASPPAQDGTAAAAAQTGQPDKPKKPPKDPSQKVVCVEQQQMGSLFTKRICATRAQWDERARRDREQMEQTENMGRNTRE